MMRFILSGILVLMAAALGFIAFQWYHMRFATEAYGAPFTLVDQRGEPITEAAFRGQPSAVFFGFTHCPEVCPTTLFELDGWLKKLGDDGKNIRAYFVSVDPERDTAEIMNAYVGNVSDRITGITGEPDKVPPWPSRSTSTGARSTPATATTRWTTPPRCCCLHGSGDFAGTIAYGENPDTALAKLKRLAEEG